MGCTRRVQTVEWCNSLLFPLQAMQICLIVNLTYSDSFCRFAILRLTPKTAERMIKRASKEKKDSLKYRSASCYQQQQKEGGKAFEGVSASKRKRASCGSALPLPRPRSTARSGRRGAGGAPSQLSSQGRELFGLDEEFQVETI